MPRIDRYIENLNNISLGIYYGQRKKFDKAFKEQNMLRILAGESTMKEVVDKMDVNNLKVI
ncbi:hypothetical protein BBD42_17325 [Paenibacillus sp. BIHB 4019]|uniref:Uncharacterized protein n=1 Tax=Paenibacillus sp. BIHB 4019 TaxID=1870819 RepID=A0A1B2DJY7_9BACL|nr:hypothetical protein BBD42_17325 [Paenibacillus sp. BIHB 4019]